MFTHSAISDDSPLTLVPRLPTRWAVCLLADAEGRPVQLLTFKNPRVSLKHRLEEIPADVRSRRVRLAEVVRQIHWRRVDSRFEAEWVYLEAARHFFPQTYRELAPAAPAWFAHVDPDAAFPRYTRTDKPGAAQGQYFGPLEDRAAAARFIELVEDAFELCRYYNVLLAAPAGRPCAYKEMGRCAGPCDGTISMDAYRQLVHFSADALADPAPLIEQTRQRMAAAAAELRFESAGKIKAYLDNLLALHKGPFRHVRPLDRLNYLCLTTGPKEHQAKAFVFANGQITESAGIVNIDQPQVELAQLVRSVPLPPADPARAAEHFGLLARHLFSTKADRARFIELADLNENALATALRELRPTEELVADPQG